MTDENQYIIHLEHKITNLEQEIQQLNAFCWYSLFRNGQNFHDSEMIQRPSVATVKYLLENPYMKHLGSMRSFSSYLQNEWLRYASQQEWIDVLPSLIYSNFTWVCQGLFFVLLHLRFSNNKEYFLPRFENALESVYEDEEVVSIMTKVKIAYNY